MDLFAAIAILYVFSCIIVIFYRPELILGIQLFATPIISNALFSLGISIGAVPVIFSLAVLSFVIFLLRSRQAVILPSTRIEVGIILLIAWAAITLTYTPSPVYGSSKMTLLAIIGFSYMYMARFFCDTPAKLHQTFTTAGLHAIVLLAYYGTYVVLNSGESIRIRADFFGPLPLGYAVATMLPFIFYIAVTTQSAKLKTLAIPAIPVAILVIVATGSRGPLLAVIVAATLALLRRQHLFKALACFAIVTAAAIGYLSTEAASENKGLARILGETHHAGNSNDTRLLLFSNAIDQFVEYPLFGQGIGSLSSFVGVGDQRLYAHNSFLEIAGEFGLIGLSIFLAILMFCIFQIKNLRNNSHHEQANDYWAIASLQALFFIGFVNSNVAFSLPGQKIYFVSFGVIAATTLWYTEKKTRRSVTFH